MFNPILSLFALTLLGAIEPYTTPSRPDDVVDAVFRDAADSPVSPIIERPDWMKGQREQIRGQSPMYDSPPGSPPLGSTFQPMQPINPFQAGADPVIPYLNDPGPTIISGVNGPQPQRLGFTPLFDGTFILPSKVKSPASGYFGAQEYDVGLRHVSILGPDWIFTNTAQAGTRVWTGPNAPNLPPQVYRFGWDFLLTSPQVNCLTVQFDFNPSINSDLQSALGREAINLDGNITGFVRVSPQFMWVVGAQYWDRVQKIIIPNAGFVWNPTDQLEFRIVFPKSRISYFVGNIGGGAHWLYATGEYHVESYEIQMPGVVGANQIQLSDYRFALGLRSDHATYDKYLEVGYVIDRQAKFLHATPNFDIQNGIMFRFGIRF